MATPDPDGLAQDLTARYELGEKLGKGGFGSVHRARERGSGREVALKLLHIEKGARALERFLREATVTATLDHPGIVRVHAAGVHGGRPCIVYELVDGETFEQATKPLDHRARAALVRDAARAVGHAHARGVVHRDLKPDNLFVDRQGRLRVGDFGLVRVEGAERLTRTGALVGTPHYMAPEMFRLDESSSAATPAADVWSLGVVLYEALTGRRPFEATNLVVLAAQVDEARVERPSSIDPRVEAALEAVCLRALAKDPARRYPDGEALAAALDEALSGRSLERRRLRRLLVAGAVAALTTLGLALATRGEGGGAAATAAPAPRETATATTRTAAPPPRERGRATRRQLVRKAYHPWAVVLEDLRVVTGSDQDDVCLWDAVTGELVRSWPVRALDGTRTHDGRIRMLCRGVLHELDPAREGVRRVLELALPNAMVLCARGAARTVLVTGPPAGPPTRAVVIDGDGVTAGPTDLLPTISPALALSADGRWLIVSAGDGAGTVGAHAFDLATGTPVLSQSFQFLGRAKSATFLAGSRLLAGSLSPGMLVVLDAAGAPEHERLIPSAAGAAHLRTVRAVVVSSDGARAFSCADLDDGCEVKAWDLASGEQLGEAVRLSGAGRAMDLAPDGQLLAVVTERHGVHVLPAEDLGR